jgi:hypothetical protein
VGARARVSRESLSVGIRGGNAQGGGGAGARTNSRGSGCRGVHEIRGEGTAEA